MESTLRSPGVGITLGDSLMWAERLPCLLSSPPLRLISRVRRDHEEGPVTTGLSLFIYLFFSYPLPNHFLSPSSRRPPPRISPFALLAHTIIYSFIPLRRVVFPFGTLIFLFSLDLCGGGQKEEKRTQMAPKAKSRTWCGGGATSFFARESSCCCHQRPRTMCIFVACHRV